MMHTEEHLQIFIYIGVKCALIALTQSDLFFFQAEDGIRDADVTGVQTCALPISDGFELQWGDREHYVKREFAFDDKILDPDRPEFLMYRDTPRGKLLMGFMFFTRNLRSEEHTSELQSRPHLVCRLLLEKKK